VRKVPKREETYRLGVASRVKRIGVSGGSWGRTPVVEKGVIKGRTWREKLPAGHP